MNTVFNRRTVLMAAALGASTTLLLACGGSDDDEPQRNIVELAQSNPDLSILVEAVVAAGLAPTLSTGSLTVGGIIAAEPDKAREPVIIESSTRSVIGIA